MTSPWLSWGSLFVGGLFWLLQGEGDGGAEELECSALGVGGLGKRGYGVVGAGEVDLVAGEGAQVGEQSLVAVGGQVSVVVFREALVLAAVDRCAGATGLSRSGGFSSVKVNGANALRRCQ